MKTILLILLTVTVIFSFGCSSNNKSSSDKNGNTNTNGNHSNEESWATLDYHFRTGTVAPEYYYHYRIIINKDKSAQFIFYPSYADTGYSQQSYTITDSQLSSLNSAVTGSKVLTDNISQESDHPIGGSNQSLTVTLSQGADLDQMPKTISVPSYPEAKYEAGLENLYKVIEGTLPAGMLEAEKEKKEGN